MSAYQDIKVETAEGICRITLCVPEKKNAIGPRMANELLHALDDAQGDDGVRVIVFSGAEGNFCAGGDLKQMPAGGLAQKGDYADLLLRFPGLGKPTVAKVQGFAMGGGLGLMASCDFVLAAKSAVLGTPEIKRGLFPMMIMAVLARQVPRRRLLEMMLLGGRLSPDEGKAFGLVNRVLDAEALDEAVNRMAVDLGAQSPAAMKHGLLAYHAQSEKNLQEAIPFLKRQLVELLGTEDAQERLRAFGEKREPVWKS